MTEPKPLTSAQKHVLSEICKAPAPVLSGFRTRIAGRIIRRGTMRALFRGGFLTTRVDERSQVTRFVPTPAGQLVGASKST